MQHATLDISTEVIRIEHGDPQSMFDPAARTRAVTYLGCRLTEMAISHNAMHMQHRIDEMKILICNYKDFWLWIAAISHLLWEWRGFRFGYAWEDWFDAQRLVTESFTMTQDETLSRRDEDTLTSYQDAAFEDYTSGGLAHEPGPAHDERREVPLHVTLPTELKGVVHLEGGSHERMQSVVEAAKELARTLGYKLEEDPEDRTLKK